MKIAADGWIDIATRMPSPHVGGEIPVLAVLNHWTAGGSALVSEQVLRDRGLCAQLISRRGGGFIQTAPLHRHGSHAGNSAWRGMPACSNFMIGIEHANWGPVFWDEHRGRWYTSYFNARTALSVPYDGLEPVEVRDTGVTIQHHGGRHVPCTHFEPFSPLQIESAEEVHAAIAERYPTCVAAVDHATVAPGRKVDCIPWQPMIAGWGMAFAGRPMPGMAEVAKTPDSVTRVNYRRAQEALNAAGARPVLAVDGVMGPKTHRAIEAFQRAMRLLPVGVLNDETIAALGIGD